MDRLLPASPLAPVTPALERSISTPDDFRDPRSCRPVQPAAPRRSQETLGSRNRLVDHRGVVCRHCATRIRDAQRTRLTLDDLADVIASAAEHPGRSYRVTW